MITDEQIAQALARFNGFMNAPVIDGLDQSKSMQRLVRCWFDEVTTYCYSQCSDESMHFHHFHEDIVKIRGPANLDEIPLGWFNHFALGVVFRAMCVIHHRESDMRDRKPSDGAIAQHLDDELNALLESYDTRTVAAVRKLREAAELVGLPRGYFLTRDLEIGTLTDRLVKAAEWKLDGNEGYFQTTRRPVVEPYSSEKAENEHHQAVCDAMTSVDYILQTHEIEVQHLAKRGKKSLEQWAIRKLWGNVCETFEYLGVAPKLEKPWVTVRDVLALCNVHVDTETVRDTLNPRAKRTTG